MVLDPSFAFGYVDISGRSCNLGFTYFQDVNDLSKSEDAMISMMPPEQLARFCTIHCSKRSVPPVNHALDTAE